MVIATFKLLRNARWLAAFCLSFVLSLCLSTPAVAQTPEASGTPTVPVVSGGVAFVPFVQGGQTTLVSIISPVVLLPLGDNWLIESRGAFEGDFTRRDGTGPFGGKIHKQLEYLQLDYIAHRYLTVTAGRFLTPFGIYNERLYPIWIRSLQPTPLIFPLGTGSSDGVMLRGGFSINPKINLNYATYFSTLSTVNKFESDRTSGGRLGFFLPGPRIEAGVSFQKELQHERSNAFGFHFAWQPAAVPLNLRSEYARSHDGSGYWIEVAYRLSQAPFWQKTMRRTEIIGRGQQLFAGQISKDEAEEYGLPDVNTRQGDFGLNYYLRDGLKASASYSRRFNSDGNVNLWTVGLAYHFALPLGRVGPQ